MISVIVPFYKTNQQHFRYCLESLRLQTFQDFEVLLMDDGNTAEYLQVANEYVASDRRFKIIRLNHTGVSEARNIGIREANGEYIVFCDSDDYVANNYLESLYKGLEYADIAICGVAWEGIVQNTIVNRSVFQSLPSQFNWLVYVNFPVNKIFKTNILKEHGIYFRKDVKLGEDAIFFADYIKYCTTIKCIQNNLYYYIRTYNSATKNFNPNYWNWEQEVIQRQYDLFTEYPLGEEESHFMQWWLYDKLKGAICYYLDSVNFDYNSVVADIISSKYFQYIYHGHEFNPRFTRKDRFIIRLFKRFNIKGIEGFQYFRNMKKALNKIRY